MTISHTEIMLALWREVGRHRDAAESIGVLAELLARLLPLHALRLDAPGVGSADLVTLALWEATHGLSRLYHPSGDTPKMRKELVAWAKRGEVAECHAQAAWPPYLAVLGNCGESATLLAGPLVKDKTFIGIAVVAGTRVFTAAEKALLQETLEPLAAVVSNDMRSRELTRLAARAETERDALLSRLGRKGINESVLGAQGGLRQVMRRVEQVAQTDTTVLILGETGAGKEVIARTIHERSARHDGPFIRVNCGAVAPELIDSELFGHERGSFTGAFSTRRGWFERADGGTLFLDEIGELTPPVQVRLLRVLQDGIVQRLGSEQELTVDVRIIAATHRDLPLLVQDGLFREDLWYRIAIFPIILPPLHERPEDIPELALHFMQRAAHRLGLRTPVLDDEAIVRLRSYSWPGNVREFAAVIERAIILGQGSHLDLDHALGTGSAPANGPTFARNVATATTPELPPGQTIDSLDQAIKAHIKLALMHCNGRVDGPYGAAKLLQLNPSTLRSKMRKFGIAAK